MKEMFGRKVRASRVLIGVWRWDGRKKNVRERHSCDWKGSVTLASFSLGG